MLIVIDDAELIIRSELLSSLNSTFSSPSNGSAATFTSASTSTHFHFQLMRLIRVPDPTKLATVPPSKDRDGDHTPRSESLFITGCQVLFVLGCVSVILADQGFGLASGSGSTDSLVLDR